MSKIFLFGLKQEGEETLFVCRTTYYPSLPESGRLALFRLEDGNYYDHLEVGNNEARAKVWLDWIKETPSQFSEPEDLKFLDQLVVIPYDEVS